MECYALGGNKYQKQLEAKLLQNVVARFIDRQEIKQDIC